MKTRRDAIFCHCCEGKGTITERKYKSGEEIACVCPECNGNKWVWSEIEVDLKRRQNKW